MNSSKCETHNRKASTVTSIQKIDEAIEALAKLVRDDERFSETAVRLYDNLTTLRNHLTDKESK